MAFIFQRQPTFPVKINLVTFKGPLSDLYLTYLRTVEQDCTNILSTNQILPTPSRNILSSGMGIFSPVFAASCKKLVSDSDALLDLTQVRKGTKKPKRPQRAEPTSCRGVSEVTVAFCDTTSKHRKCEIFASGGEGSKTQTYGRTSGKRWCSGACGVT